MLVVISGVVQVAGVALVLGGPLSHQNVLVIDGPADVHATTVPMPLKDGFGVAAVGSI